MGQSFYLLQHGGAGRRQRGELSGVCLGVAPSCVFGLAVLKSYVKSKGPSVDAKGCPVGKGEALVHESITSPVQPSALRGRQAATDLGEQQTQGRWRGSNCARNVQGP